MSYKEFLVWLGKGGSLARAWAKIAKWIALRHVLGCTPGQFDARNLNGRLLAGVRLQIIACLTAV